MLVQLLTRLVHYRGVEGGAAMADSLLQRSIRLQNMGGLSGALYAIEEVLTILGDGCRCTYFLLALAEMPGNDPSFGQTIAQCFAEQSRGRPHIDQWAPARLPPRERMTAMTACNLAISRSAALPDKLKTDLAAQTRPDPGLLPGRGQSHRENRQFPAILWPFAPCAWSNSAAPAC